MNLKTAITLLLGLVFQLAQVMPCALVRTPCSADAASCECCMAGKVCHCADHGDSGRKPPPAPFDAGRLSHLAAMKTVETKVAVDPLRENDASATAGAVPREGSLSGYTGVRLSVAYCSFVI